MKKKKTTKKNKATKMEKVLVGLFIGTLILLSINLTIILQKFDFSTNGRSTNYMVSEGEEIFNLTLENYYDVEYSNDISGLTIRINNPCIFVRTGNGKSMLPYWQDEELFIVDACYDADKLEVGDVISWSYDNETNIHHRIIAIDRENNQFLTKGDNNEGNDGSWISFDDFRGRDIGVLNVLMDKIVVNKKSENIYYDDDRIQIYTGSKNYRLWRNQDG